MLRFISDLIENSRGGQTLVHNGYMFRLKMGKEESRYWYCQKKDCPARINTKNDNITKASGIHNHMQDQTAISVAEMKSNMRKRVVKVLSRFHQSSLRWLPL